MNVSISKVKASDFLECLEVIHQSFKTVAEGFGLTRENCPKHTSFIPLSFLEAQMNWGWHMYALYAGEKIIGYVLNTNTKKFHIPSCSSVKTIKDKNYAEYVGIAEEVETMVYVGCKRCNPK